MQLPLYVRDLIKIFSRPKSFKFYNELRVFPQPIKTRYLGHVTGYQPIRDQYFLIWSVPDFKIYILSREIVI